MASAGKDVEAFFEDIARTVRVNVDFSTLTVERLDKLASTHSITRQALIKIAVMEWLEKRPSAG